MSNTNWIKDSYSKVCSILKSSITMVFIVGALLVFIGVIGGSIKSVSQLMYKKGQVDLVQNLCENDSSYDFCEVESVSYKLREGIVK